MKKLLIYLKDYRKETILGPLFKLLEASFELLVPLVVASIIDNGIAKADNTHVIRMCLLLGLLAAIGLVSALTAQYFAAKASVGLATRIRHTLFCHIQSLSFSELDSIGTSTLITRMTSDINQVQTGVNLTLRLLLRSPLVVFGAMIMAFTVDVRAALIFAVVIPILAVVVFLIMLASIPLYKKVQAHLDSVLGITRENLTGNRVIRAFCKEEEEIQSFTQKNEALTGIQEFVGKISALMNPLTFVILNVAIIALIHTGAIRVEAGLLTQGAVVALYNYMSQILVELVKIANLIINITKSIACGNRIQTLLEIQPSITSVSASIPQTTDEIAVEFQNVSLKYHKTADDSLSNISFRVKKGETIGIIGGTGSGKSSLVNLIPRFYEATEGTILVNGADVRTYPLEALRKKIAIVPQKAVLFKGTIRENLLWGNENATDEELIAALTMAQGADILTKKEEGLDSKIEQGGKNLSGGQRQRMTIARALVRKAEILILDDSASALDYATEAALRQALKSITPEPTVIIVSQRTASIMHADRIFVLEDGVLVGAGTHKELLDSCEIYQEIYDSQFRKEEE
ncbi:MAG: ABC transporter ATP-binding protein [Ruminococcaceae bacterium]|nr:ABC transporter ATP-binding protein [Oscillospiraceae bacterium]